MTAGATAFGRRSGTARERLGCVVVSFLLLLWLG